ncbi:MAG: AsnC family transcriptional regulator [Nitriliruptorales bacterium]|nr:AsnC family transcriptional regulator [Nitriliruptorales bacterium]
MVPRTTQQTCEHADGSSAQRRTPVDSIDHRLLELLKNDARLSMADLGRLVGLSRTAALARVRRLERTGTIRGYHADVSAAPYEEHVARVGIVVNAADTAAYVRRLMSIEEVTEAETVAGELDLLVRMTAANAARLDAVLDRVNAWHETMRTTTFVVLRKYTR